MMFEGPFQPKPFYDSMTLRLTIWNKQELTFSSQEFRKLCTATKPHCKTAS